MDRALLLLFALAFVHCDPIKREFHEDTLSDDDTDDDDKIKYLKRDLKDSGEELRDVQYDIKDAKELSKAIKAAPRNDKKVQILKSDLRDAEAKLRGVKDNIKDAEKQSRGIIEKDMKAIKRLENILNERLTPLTKRVVGVNGALKKRKDEKNNEQLSSLENSLKEAIAKDEVKKKDEVKSKDVSPKNTKELYPSDDVFAGDLNNDDQDVKKEASEPKMEAGMPDSPKSDVNKKADEEVEIEKKMQLKEIKDTVSRVKDELKGMKQDIKYMKKVFKKNIKDKPLDETTKNKLEEIKGNVKDIMSDFETIKDIMVSDHEKDAMQDESTTMMSKDSMYETQTILSGVKDQLQETSSAIHDLAKIAKREEEQKELDEDAAKMDKAEDEQKVKDDSVKTTRVDDEQKIQEDADDMTELDMLKDGMKDVIDRMQDVRKSIKERNSKEMLKRDAKPKEADELDVSGRIASIKNDFNNIKEMVDDMAERHI